jgi:hypothetical protein
VPDEEPRCWTCCATGSGDQRQGRLQPAGSVRLLHGARRRCAAGGVRDSGATAGRPGRDDARRGPPRSSRRGRRRSWPPGPASAGSARPASSCGSRACGPRASLPTTVPAVERALQAHLCRCTGWRTIVEAYAAVVDPAGHETAVEIEGRMSADRDLEAAGRRAAIEGHAEQHVGAETRSDGPGSQPTRLRPTPWWPCPTVRAVGGRRDAGRGPCRQRQGAGPAHDGRDGAAPRASEGDWVVTAHVVGRAGLPRDRRLVVRPWGDPVSPLANGEPSGARSTRRLPRPPGAGRPARSAGAGALLPGRCGRARPSGPRSRRASGPMAPASSGSPAPGGRRADRRCGARPRGGGGRRPRSSDLDLGPPPGGPRSRCCLPPSPATGAVGADEPIRVEGTDGEWPTRRSSDRRRRGRGARPRGLRRTARRGRAAVLRHRCRTHGHRLGHLGRAGRGRGRRGPRPHDPLVRCPRAIDTPAVEVEIEPASGPPVNGSDAVFAAVAAAVWRHQGFPRSGLPASPSAPGVARSGAVPTMRPDQEICHGPALHPDRASATG